MIENKNQPAFPVENDMSDKMQPSDVFHGLSKREYFAGLAMQGLCTATDSDGVWMADASASTAIAENAVKIADALLLELSKPQP